MCSKPWPKSWSMFTVYLTALLWWSLMTPRAPYIMGQNCPPSPLHPPKLTGSHPTQIVLLTDPIIHLAQKLWMFSRKYVFYKLICTVYVHCTLSKFFWKLSNVRLKMQSQKSSFPEVRHIKQPHPESSGIYHFGSKFRTFILSKQTILGAPTKHLTTQGLTTKCA